MSPASDAGEGLRGQRFLFTAAGGFFGRHLVARLGGDGADVVALTRATWERSISSLIRSKGIARSCSATKSFTPTTICSFDSTAH